MYIPPFNITNKMLELCIRITDKLGSLNSFQSLNRMPILRRNNKIKSVHSSLAIESNSLSLNQVRDVINGKTVLGPQKEIQEVKNAYEAYNMIDKLNYVSQKDLLKAHGVMTYLVDDESGKYRNHPEGVFDGERVIFIAPPSDMIHTLMNDLFDWLENDLETPILIKSCIFHYEFVFIHPFGDGNGRMARLWQNLILSKWKPLFEYMPIESLIQKYQAEYYDAIAKCNINGDSNIFIEFMLQMIEKTIDEILVGVKKESRNISEQVNKLLEVMEPDIPYSANELMERLGIKSKETLRGSYLNPALENGLVKMTLPNKVNRKSQKYIK